MIIKYWHDIPMDIYIYICIVDNILMINIHYKTLASSGLKH